MNENGRWELTRRLTLKPLKWKRCWAPNYASK